MYQLSGLVPSRNIFFVFCFSIFFSPFFINAQPCTTPENFEATQYNSDKATYEWDFAPDALYYVIDIQINEQQYIIAELPGSASDFALEFVPKLKNYDKVSAKLTKYCALGGSANTTFDFVIITDGVVYLNGGPQNGDPNAVEPVYTVNDNLVPATGICGLCEPGFFRLTSGFYGPYGIYTDPLIPHTIEQLRFKKDELCGCIDKAIDEGLLDANGGPGPNYIGEPFQCKLTPYVFEKRDCERGKEEGGERNSPAAVADLKAIPNPVTSVTQITFTLPETSSFTLSVYDFTGRFMSQTVHSAPVPAGVCQESLNTENWPRGLYYCTLQAGAVMQTIKMVKM